MSNKKSVSLAVVTLIVTTTLISACTQSLSQAPVATPTLISDTLFVSPFPSAENPMAMIEQFAKQTAAAQTIAAGGVVATSTPGTPSADTTGITTITATPQSGATNTPGVGQLNTPTNANAAVVATTAVAPIVAATTAVVINSTAVPVGVRPASYTLQAGEFPYCIARRFNVDPNALLSASGLSDSNFYYPGLVLRIPQSGAFPGDRVLASHPATYNVTSSDETLYGIACKYGDIDPATIASANGISTGAVLSPGQQIKIP